MGKCFSPSPKSQVPSPPQSFLNAVIGNTLAARRAGTQPYRALDVFSDVLAHVENSYVEDVDEKELVYGAIDGMMAKLDPHSVFMRPDVYRQMRDETTGEFDGLGLAAVVGSVIVFGAALVSARLLPRNATVQVPPMEGELDLEPTPVD